MDAKNCRVNRMNILKRKRMSRQLPVYRRRKVARRLDIPIRFGYSVGVQNINPNYQSPFQDSVTELGSSSRSTIDANRVPLRDVTSPTRTVERNLVNEVSDDTATANGNQLTQQSASTVNHGSTPMRGRHKRSHFEIWDFGRPLNQCPYCKAIVWYEERTLKSKRPINPKFSICCAEGKVKLRPFHDTPAFLKELLDYNRGRISKKFRQNIRCYNSMFAFTSTGGVVDRSINDGNGPYVYRINGQNHHRFGTLLPADGERPRFLQLYIYDTANEVSNRMNAVQSDEGSNMYDVAVVNGLLRMLDECNPLVRVFRMARDQFRDHDFRPIRIRLIAKRQNDGPQYNLPTASEVAPLIVGSENLQIECRDVIVDERGVGLRRITEIHPSFMAMQYPILFPYGEDFYRIDIPYVDVAGARPRKRQRVTFRETFAYRLLQRNGEGDTLLRGGRLFQQFCCDAFTTMEAGRIRWICLNQGQLRRELYNGLMDSVVRGDTNATSIGRRIILPSSFTRGPRYMVQNYQDAMAICRWAGTPDLFITFTCNPNWREIQYGCDCIGGQTWDDRPDQVSRVFKIKLDELMVDLRKRNHFGQVNAAIYTIEFQKRGLPHAHLLLFLKPESKKKEPSEIDEIISAEILDRREDRVGHDAVVQYMMHGPCGAYNMDCACMDGDSCVKQYPKTFCSETTMNADGYPIYRRRDDKITALKNGVELDNRWVVPHNVDLVVKYNSHINVEYCNQGRSIKYLFKYINKGHDRATFQIDENLIIDPETGATTIEEVNEPSRFATGRYASGAESCWRGLGFDIHYRDVAVERLSFHLPGEHSVIFRDQEALVDVVSRVGVEKTIFTEWMVANQNYEDARELRYGDFPTKWTWKKNRKEWTRRQCGRTIGRLYFVHPTAGEKYYLRMLLNVVKGATCFEDIRTVNGVLYPSFKEACGARGLLDNDQEWHEVLHEAARWASAHQLRELFVTLVLFSEVTDLFSLWINNWEILSDDIEYRQRRRCRNLTLSLTPDQIQNYALYEIELLMNKSDRSLIGFQSIPFPDMRLINVSRNSMVMEEIGIDRDVYREEHSSLYPGLNVEQKDVYDKIVQAAQSGSGGFFFVYGSGGTGKTYLWKTIISRLRSEGQIVLSVASSGIAALLLPRGRTSHSRFKLPINLTEDCCCEINQGSQLADLIIKASLIIWDEAPMCHRYAFEALDRTLRDILRFTVPDSLNKPFGGKTVVLGGDFRQILPVVPKGGREQIVGASISQSPLWDHCQIFKLTVNMRLRTVSSNTETTQSISEFSRWVLDLGDGTLHARSFHRAEETNWVKIPTNIFMNPGPNPIDQIVSWTYPNFMDSHVDADYLRGRAILTTTNEDVDKVNDYMQSKFNGRSRVYLSFDKLTVESGSVDEQSILFPTEFLNTLKFPGIPNHELELKEGVPVILLRNINPSEGLCNGTRLIIKKLGARIIEAEVITGSKQNVGKIVLIHRIVMSPVDTNWPFQLQRRQFPLKVCFAMTINKSQGQTFNHVGVYLPKPVFSHGQLYVAVSRVTSRQGLKILAVESENHRMGYTKNIVYHEIFDRLP